MIIKVTRGNDFTGAIDYIARLGIYARKDSARVIALERLYDLRTAASQLGYDAARDLSRSRPVVHLIARAERGLSDDQYLNLVRRMLRAAGLEGRRFIATAHDDDGHLHAVASEVDEDGAAPPRILWHKGEKRVVTAEEAKALPRGAVTGRAWDSHLAWRMTRVAREVEIEWNLRRLSTSAKANTPVEPRSEQWQKERLARTGRVSLQDRYWDEVRVALALPTWDARAAALNAHALGIRTHEVGGRVRGLQVQNLSDAQDFVKISAFEMGGMAKLDASAGQPFLEWAAQERQQLINLTKPATSRNPGMIAMQAAFKSHQKDWRRREGARFAAWRQRKRDTVAISEAMDDFANRFRPILTVPVFRQARAEHRRGLKNIADRRLADSLSDAGPATPKPVFIDFVKARAGAGDAAAAGVYGDIVGDVSETRRRALDRVAAMVRELAGAARTLGERRDRLRQDVAAAAMAFNHVIRQLELADVELDALRRRALLTFVVAGGGFSGTETIGEIGELVSRSLVYFPRISATEVRFCLVHSQGRLLPELPEKLGVAARRILEARGIQVILDARVRAVSRDQVFLSTGQAIASRTFVCTVGTAPNPVAKDAMDEGGLAEAQNNGRGMGIFAVDGMLACIGSAGHWAVGDDAGVPDPKGKGFCPPTAQFAIREARVCARNILAMIDGAPLAAFSFEVVGMLASLGQRRAVAQMFGVTFSGFFAWFMWRTVYLMKLPGFVRRLRVAIDWTLDLFFPRDITQLDTDRPRRMDVRHYEPGEVIVQQGTIGGELFMITSGTVEVLGEDRGATSKVLARLGAREVFGEKALLEDTLRTATVRASSAVDVLVMPREDFRSLIAQFPVLEDHFGNLTRTR